MKEETKPWYKSPIFYLKAGLFAVAFPLAFSYLILRETAIPMKKRVIYLTGLWGFLFLILFSRVEGRQYEVVTVPAPTSQEVTSHPEKEEPPTVTQEIDQYEYEILRKQDNGNVENISVLVDPGKPNGEAIAMQVKNTCSKPCNIDVYDDKKAYELQSEYDNMGGDINTLTSRREAWKKKNYVFVGDHLIGYINFELGTYDDYPFKDWYYDELKGN